MAHVFIIAEAGSNHDGDLARAKLLVEVAVAAGANACKFQLIPPFKPEWIDTLIEYCGDRIEFMATPFNQAGIDALKGKVKRWKIASTEAADASFVQRVMKAAEGQPVYISDGARPAIESDYPNLIPLACVVEYPAKEQQYHFPYKGIWGVSDHTLGNILGALAVAHGATVVEKHFTDDRTRPGPDHSYALSPVELNRYTELIRVAEHLISNPIKHTIQTYVGRKIEWP